MKLLNGPMPIAYTIPPTKPLVSPLRLNAIRTAPLHPRALHRARLSISSR